MSLNVSLNAAGTGFIQRHSASRNLPEDGGPLTHHPVTNLPSEKAFVEKSNGLDFLRNRKIDYQIDYNTKGLIVQVINQETGEVIRQIPGDNLLHFDNQTQRLHQNRLDEMV